MTPAAQRFVGAASFEGIVGAPVLSTSSSAIPMRGAFPGDPLARPRPHRPPRAGRQRRRLPGRAGVGQHLAKLAAGIADSMLTHLVPGLPGAARRRPGDERPDVRGRRHPGEPGDAARARGAGDRARGGGAGLARRDGRRQAAVARAPAGRGRGAAAGRARIAGTGCGCWSPRAGPGSRSTPSASSATARAAGWGWRSPSRPPAGARR